jgi:hypothetical protein
MAEHPEDPPGFPSTMCRSTASSAPLDFAPHSTSRASCAPQLTCEDQRPLPDPPRSHRTPPLQSGWARSPSHPLSARRQPSSGACENTGRETARPSGSPPPLGEPESPDSLPAHPELILCIASAPRRPHPFLAPAKGRSGPHLPTTASLSSPDVAPRLATGAVAHWWSHPEPSAMQTRSLATWRSPRPQETGPITCWSNFTFPGIAEFVHRRLAPRHSSLRTAPTRTRE